MASACERNVTDIGSELDLYQEIRFGVSPSSETKAELVNSTSDLSDLSVKVWGNRNVSSTPAEIFDGVALTPNTWTYAPPVPWDWSYNVTYDFLAVAAKSSSFPTIPEAESSASSVSVSYSIGDGEGYDLMMSGVHRESRSTEVVELQMQHMLCAVEIEVKNIGTLDVSGVSFVLNNVVKSGTCTYSLSDGQYGAAWTGLSAKASTVSTSVGSVVVDATSSSTIFCLVPQSIAEESYPQISVTYTPFGKSEETKSAHFKDAVSQAPITQWVAGTKYLYVINLNCNENVSVVVQTTPWDVIDAETPDILL